MRKQQKAADPEPPRKKARRQVHIFRKDISSVSLCADL